jgi:2-oxoglutarate ferredoxin oxidoreductase subunit beta
VHIVADNENYALTTGQASPTTPENIKTKSTPD